MNRINKEARNLSASLRSIASKIEAETLRENCEGCTLLELAIDAESDIIRFTKWYLYNHEE